MRHSPSIGARYHELARYRSSPTKEVVLLEKPLSESAAAPRVTR